MAKTATAARMPRMAMTTRSSTRVKPLSSEFLAFQIALIMLWIFLLSARGGPFPAPHRIVRHHHCHCEAIPQMAGSWAPTGTVEPWARAGPDLEAGDGVSRRAG